MLLIFTSLTTNNAENLFTYLVIYIPSFVKYLFKFFAPFLLGFFTSYWVVRIIYTSLPLSLTTLREASCHTVKFCRVSYPIKGQGKEKVLQLTASEELWLSVQQSARIWVLPTTKEEKKETDTIMGEWKTVWFFSISSLLSRKWAITDLSTSMTPTSDESPWPPNFAFKNIF